MQEIRKLLDGFHARSRNFFDGQALPHFAGGFDGIRFFDVGGVAAGRAVDKLVFAGIGDQHELVRTLAADSAGVRLDQHARQPAAGVDVLVGLHHGVVALVQPGLVDVETVGVLHNELAHPD